MLVEKTKTKPWLVANGQTICSEAWNKTSTLTKAHYGKWVYSVSILEQHVHANIQHKNNTTHSQEAIAG